MEHICYGPKMKYVFNKNTLQFAIFKIGSHEDFQNIHPTSAGFLYFYNYQNQYGEKQIGVECFGESISLNLKFDEEDSKKITFLLKED